MKKPVEGPQVTDLRDKLEEIRDQSKTLTRQEAEVQVELDLAIQEALHVHQTEVEGRNELGGES